MKYRKIIWRDVQWIEAKDLFLPEFSFIDLEDALPGAFLPDEAQSLIFKGQNITPLLPLNPILLDYFTPEDLISKIQLNLLNGSDGSLVRVTLHLPLSGIKNDENNPQNFSIFNDYPIKEENALTEVPVLELWPHFRAEGWREYYGFYYDNQVLASTRPGDKTFQISLPEAKAPHLFQVDRGSYQITHLEEFPAFINCQDESRNLIGLILLKTPEQLQLNGSWKVGVDFGTSFTNIYVNRKGNPEPLPLESLHLKIADAQTESRFPALAEYFIPENFYPLEKPLPLSNLLTTRGSPHNSKKERPIYEGRIYIPSPSFDPNEEWFETNVNWSNINLFTRLFLKHLALHITAMAANNGVRQIQWAFSYPSTFSRSDKTRYTAYCKHFTEDLQDKTGIIHICPEPNNLDYFRPESLATAQYFVDFEGYELVNTTCINMGDDTSDISIWEASTTCKKLVYQCNLQLGGKHLFNQFLELNPNFLVQRFELDPQDWQGLKEGNFNAKLDVSLRYEGDNWLKKRDFFEGEEDFQGLIRLMAIGTAGLYYYVGTILRVLYQRGQYSRNEITPVYLGGNGSRLLNWLAVGGIFDRHCEVNELFSLMLSKGSGFEDTKVLTRLSTRPEDEVACGLVLNATRLKGHIKRPESVIAGENSTINGQPISWEDDLDLEGVIQGFDIPELVQVPNFLDDFNIALEELDIQGLTPMPAFKGNSLESSYNDRLWRDTHKELKTKLVKIRGDSDNIHVEPPFILGLKALLRVLGKEWAGK